MLPEDHELDKVDLAASVDRMDVVPTGARPSSGIFLPSRASSVISDNGNVFEEMAAADGATATSPINRPRSVRRTLLHACGRPPNPHPIQRRGLGGAGDQRPNALERQVSLGTLDLYGTEVR